jgi:hypothetical protein
MHDLIRRVNEWSSQHAPGRVWLDHTSRASLRATCLAWLAWRGSPLPADVKFETIITAVDAETRGFR